MKQIWKKTLSLALALVLTVGMLQGIAFPASAAAEKPAATGKCGDANGDGAVDVKDLVRIKAAVADPENVKASDDALITNWNQAAAQDIEVIRDLLIQKDDVFPPRDAAMIEDFECGRPAGVTFYAGPTTSVGVDKNGNHALVGAIADEGWLGVDTASYSFAQTSAIKVTIKQQNSVLLTADSFNIKTTGWKAPSSATKIGDDYILTFDESFSALSSFIVKITGGMGDVTIDNLMTCEPMDNKLANGTQGVEYTVAIPAQAEGDLTVSYRVKNTGDWNPITPAGGAYKFTPDTMGTYEVSITGETDGKVVYAAIMEFKAKDPNLIWEAETPGDIDYTIVTNNGMTTVDGEKALYLSSGGAWIYLKNLNVESEKEMDGVTIKMTYYNDNINQDYFCPYFISNSYELAKSVEKTGANEYRVLFKTPSKTLKDFSFLVNGTVYLASISAYYDPAGAADPVLNDGTMGQPYAVALPQIDGDATYVVKYRLKSADNWTTFESGNYTFTPNAAGTYEVSYLVTKNEVTVYNKTLEFKVKDPNVILDFEDGIMPGLPYGNAGETVVDDGTGNHVLQGQSPDTWMGFQGASINLGKSVTKLKITITQTGANPVNLTKGMFWLVTDTNPSLYPSSVDKNDNEYTLTFDTPFNELRTFTVQINTAMGRVTFDNITIVE